MAFFQLRDDGQASHGSAPARAAAPVARPAAVRSHAAPSRTTATRSHAVAAVDEADFTRF
jgi:hypothetical protein